MPKYTPFLIATVLTLALTAAWTPALPDTPVKSASTLESAANVILTASADAADSTRPLPGDHTVGDHRASRFARALSDRGIPPLIATGLLSMLPIFELRGGIPVGVAVLDLNPLAVYAVCVLFNLIPVLPILLLLKPLRRILGKVPPFRGIFRYLDRKVARQRATIERYEELGLTLFVGIPLPVTGAWTGSILAALLDLRIGRSFLFIFLGVLLAGILVTLLTLLRMYGLIAAAALLIGFAAVYLLRLKREVA
jgi:uncharacterized membrane protein